MKRFYSLLERTIVVVFSALGLLGMLQAEPLRTLDFEAMMEFRQIEDPVISKDGRVVAFTARPDRGNPEVRACTEEKGCVWSHELGSRPVISSDSRWVAAEMEVDLVLAEKHRDADSVLRKGMLLLDLSKGKWERIPEVRRFDFSKDGRWLAVHRFSPRPEGEKKEVSKQDNDDEKPSQLILKDLRNERERVLEGVDQFAFDSRSSFLALSREKTGEEKEAGLYLLELEESGLDRDLRLVQAGDEFSCLTWTDEEAGLAWIQRPSEGEDCRVWFISDDAGQPEQIEGIPEDWYVPLKNELTWTDDAGKLFFGIKPQSDRKFFLDEEKKNQQGLEGDPDEAADEVTQEDIDRAYALDELLKRKEVDVWHWNDPRIITNQKERWEREKDRVFTAVVSRGDSGRVVQLADLDVPEVTVPQKGDYVLGRSQIPYLKLVTWEGDFHDLYLIDQRTGRKIKIAEKTLGDAWLSPRGRYAVYYQDEAWYLYDVTEGSTRNLTSNLDVGFADELHDYPSTVPGYGSAGWLEDGSAVLIYDRFDIWRFPSKQGEPVNLTQGKGRKEAQSFRIIKTDPEQRYWKNGRRLILSSYRDKTKNFGFYSLDISSPGVEKLLEEEKKFSFLAKADDADILIYTREDYREFPDIWKASLDFSDVEKVSDVNPQVAEFAWGTAELVEWKSLDGIPLQGVLIKPGNYEEGKRYPVLVYFYRFFSQRLHEFNTPVINHRPCFPLYAGNGYAIFLPDIRFEIGRPGFSSTKCLVPGVQKLVEKGIADPKAIGLHGHSWSGYQTAFIITQSDMFAAAVAGAPVSNMTSAYGGIRWGTGLSRQFQYEMTQSRIGGSLWEYPERYIENSPLFYADRINTPLLIMFGDEDDAVPWYQGIELYMAMRRLEKEAVFLQYRGEPHHLKKYPNRLDYAIKMKEFFDHYLKGYEAPDWISKGRPYQGE